MEQAVGRIVSVITGKNTHEEATDGTRSFDMTGSWFDL